MLTGSQDTKVVQASSSTLTESKLFNYLVRNPHEYDPNKPQTNWDFDWDKRDPISLVPPPKSPILSDDDLKKIQQNLNQVKPTATRHLLLIRHGQYNLKGSSDEEKSLTTLVSRLKYTQINLPKIPICPFLFYNILTLLF